jgi:hypothetical protein
VTSRKVTIAITTSPAALRTGAPLKLPMNVRPVSMRRRWIS